MLGALTLKGYLFWCNQVSKVYNEEIWAWEIKSNKLHPHLDSQSKIILLFT